MYRVKLDPDSGMVFVFPQPTREAFWMENTYIPLTVAFLDAKGRILETQDMEPQTTILHVPSQDYVYAVEVNKAYFSTNGIKVGDTLNLHLS
jgi:uncharacterized membrane protein (UPF0127 family)